MEGEFLVISVHMQLLHFLKCFLSCRACWGKPFILNVRYISHHAQASEDFELWTHSNECLALVRRHIMQR